MTNLSEEVLYEEWKSIVMHLRDKGINVLSFGTDGKREYPEYIHKMNIELKMNIKHSYDVFHFKKNLFEEANVEIFGVKNTKKVLPEYVTNQIKIIEHFFECSSKEDARLYLHNTLLFQKQTFIVNLRSAIERLETYFENYTLFFEIPEMKTTNLCENWFHRTKPEKLKHGYKTMYGLNTIANLITVRINYDLKKALNLNFDYTVALDVLLGALKAKFQSC